MYHMNRNATIYEPGSGCLINKNIYKLWSDSTSLFEHPPKHESHEHKQDKKSQIKHEAFRNNEILWWELSVANLFTVHI